MLASYGFSSCMCAVDANFLERTANSYDQVIDVVIASACCTYPISQGYMYMLHHPWLGVFILTSVCALAWDSCRTGGRLLLPANCAEHLSAMLCGL